MAPWFRGRVREALIEKTYRDLLDLVRIYCDVIT